MIYLQQMIETPVDSPAYWKLRIRLNFYLAIETIRIKKGWTKKHLATYLSMKPEDIDKIPTGDYDPTIGKVVDICLAIGLVPDMYFTENQQK